jgi:hypothetical protein
MAAVAVAREERNLSWNRARWLGLGFFLLGVLVAVVVVGLGGYARRAFQVDVADFALFAAFYVVTQAAERLLELMSNFLPPDGETAAAKKERAIVLLGLGSLVGVLASMTFGLYFLRAVGVDYGATNDWEKALDVIVTGLVIAGGTKPLHDLVKLVEKARR